MLVRFRSRRAQGRRPKENNDQGGRPANDPSRLFFRRRFYETILSASGNGDTRRLFFAERKLRRAANNSTFLL
jgi:hypothetical protein